MTFDLRRWLRDDALPLWSSTGFDHASGMFVECLDLQGHPLLDLPRRVMVQARQIYVFTEAHLRGWFAGAPLAEQAALTMVQRFLNVDDGGGWIHSVTRDGEPFDRTRDLYAQAFVLFALASMKRLSGAEVWLDLADATLDFLDNRMATPLTGGYLETLPRKASPRRQNPHMHLLEALLALHDVAPTRGYLRRADAMIDLMTSRFVCGPRNVLVEFYDDDLSPMTPPPHSFEPGHHFEWAWLLACYDQAGGTSQVADIGRLLMDRAVNDGMMSDGTIPDEVDGAGHPISRSTRLWPYTEAVRALLSDRGGLLFERRSAMANEVIASMQARFLAPAVVGCWIDRLDADFKPLSTNVPASSLYHIVGAVGVLDHVTAIEEQAR